jgi:hypothetical protein
MSRASEFIMPDEVFDLGNVSNASFEWFDPGYHYELFDHEGVKYIRVDKSKPNDYKSDTLDWGRISRNKNLLFDLLVCVPEPLKVDWKNVESSIDVKRLMKWCHKYGLPDSHLNKRIWLKPESDSEANANNEPCVEYQPMCRIIANLAVLYKHWLAYVANDKRQLKLTYLKLLENTANRGLRNMAFSGKDVDQEELDAGKADYMRLEFSAVEMSRLTASILVDVLSDQLSSACYLLFSSPYQWVDDKTLKPILTERDDSPLVKATTVTEATLDLCFFQLIAIVNAGNGVKHIKTCYNPECGNQFWARNGHAKFCPNCDRRKVWQTQHHL